MSQADADNPSPRKLNRDSHGSVKPRQKLASIHREKYQQEPMWQASQHNPEHHFFKVSNVIRAGRKMHRDHLRESQLLGNDSIRVSDDAPDWLKSSQRMLLPSPRLPDRGLDVFNRRRDSYMTIDNQRMKSIYDNRPSSLSHKNDLEGSASSFYNSRRSRVQGNVSPKVGSLDIRDYSVRQPLLKIGAQSFVDTYSVF